MITKASIIKIIDKHIGWNKEYAYLKDDVNDMADELLKLFDTPRECNNDLIKQLKMIDESFPVTWEYVEICDECNGNGSKCKKCNGKGFCKEVHD